MNSKRLKTEIEEHKWCYVISMVAYGIVLFTGFLFPFLIVYIISVCGVILVIFVIYIIVFNYQTYKSKKMIKKIEREE